MPQEIKYTCRHIFIDGRRCQSPTLRGASAPEHFCYYHHTTRCPIPTMELRARKSHRSCREPFRLPNLEDRDSIQQAISEVVQKIAANEIDPKRAGLILFGLQTASKNLPKDPAYTSPVVDEIVLDPDYGLLAPVAELGSDRQKGAAELLLEKFAREDAEKAAQDAKVSARTFPRDMGRF